MHVLNWDIPYQKHFEEMTRIPHGSLNEKAYSDYLVTWAQRHDLRCIQDECCNVMIYKPATAGYEDHAPVILQGHMDMVCAKVPGSGHDFEKDPLQLYLEDGFLKARGTTLGADDGVGVAYMLAILESSEIKHPPLECVFTVQEEVGCAGAAGLKPEYFRARRMIGLDDVGGGTTYVTTAGSQIVNFTRSITWEAPVFPAYVLSVKGLQGGHSGVDIDKERGNAVKLMFRTLFALMKQGHLQIADVDIGAADNVIPSYGTVCFVSDIPEQRLRQLVRALHSKYWRELEFSDPGFEMVLHNGAADRVFSLRDSVEVTEFFHFLPNGMRHRSRRFENLVVASSNIGVVQICGDSLLAKNCHRGALISYIEDMEEQQQMLCRQYHMVREVVGFVAPFDYIENSPIRAKLSAVFEQATGRQLQPVYAHGGIEAGYFKRLYPDMDIVTIGPRVLDEHMVTERLDMASFAQIWQVLVRLLADL